MATLTFVYLDSTAVIGPLATAREPHSWDLCVSHAGRITAPRGWELVRHAGPLPIDPHSSPEEDDLVALADAVREGRDGFVVGSAALDGFAEPLAGLHPAATGGLLVPRVHRSEPVGRGRGHLRVLPDPPECPNDASPAP